MARASKTRRRRRSSRSGSGKPQKPQRPAPQVSEGNLQRLKKENIRLTEENTRLKRENAGLKKTVSEIHATIQGTRSKKVKVSPLESPDELALEGVSHDPLGGIM